MCTDHTTCKPRQERTLDYSPIECMGLMPAMLASSVQAVVACMQCKCAEGLHFSAFHFYALVAQLPISDLRSTVICVEVTIRSVFGGFGS